VACGCGVCSTCAAAAAGGIPSVPRPRSLAERLQKTVDKSRARLARYGLRPYEVFLVWTRWDGFERGEGVEHILARVPVFPRPRVVDLTAVALSPFGAGTIPVGSVRVEEITTQLTEENLRGTVVPGRAYFDGCRIAYPALGQPPEALASLPRDQIGKGPPGVNDEGVPEPIRFFWEICQDRAGSERRSFRILSPPFFRAGSFDWAITLERISEDMRRDGRPRTEHEAE
jgi:hypothetical protein